MAPEQYFFDEDFAEKKSTLKLLGGPWQENCIHITRALLERPVVAGNDCFSAINNCFSLANYKYWLSW
jgi:hypothetical protein